MTGTLSHGDRNHQEICGGSSFEEGQPTDGPSERDALIGEGFEAGQLANATRIGAAVSRMAARFAMGDEALAPLVCARQDAVALVDCADEIVTGLQPLTTAECCQLFLNTEESKAEERLRTSEQKPYHAIV